MIAVETLSFWRTQAMASCASESPASSASGRSFWTASRTSSFMKRLIMWAPPFSSVAREPSGGCCPGRYLPVSTPWAIGEKTIWPRPSSCEVGTMSCSMIRHRIEYCGWLETSGMRSSRARPCALRIWSAVHSETPM